jgi:hypothetical protein
VSIECIEYKPHPSGALQGFANFRVPKMGIEIYGCGVFMKDGKRWVSMPSRDYKDPENGEKKYISIMRFIVQSHNESFVTAALAALDKWCQEHSVLEVKPSEFVASDPDADKVPF